MQISHIFHVSAAVWFLAGLVVGILWSQQWYPAYRQSSKDVSPRTTFSEPDDSLLEPTIAGMTSHEAEQAIEQLRSQLAQTQLAYRIAVEASQFRAGYLARTAHELRSPLNSIIGIHQMILADLCDDPAEEREFIAQANEAAMKFVKLMDRLIYAARVDVDYKMMLQIRPVQLAQVIAEVDELCRLQAQNRNLTLQVDSPNPDIYVSADLPCFRQVLLSLVDTPLRLMHDGTVQVTSHIKGEYACIDIEDDRPADLWQEPLNWLRQPLHQVNLATPQLSPGLTLIMDQLLLEKMGGRLELLSVPNQQETTPSTSQTRLRCMIPLHR
ncbi:MAG: HAMP domain-containing histidine kinase [Cyanobacteria bacterium]|nr:HAMP domain-containing histidine kinase [Cyanobacteriota bacterium]MDW8199930.1 HAMP domain-containing sensor histidine kinase [Cyanobacteriota bacterium SKYGB_h_bin112]